MKSFLKNKRYVSLTTLVIGTILMVISFFMPPSGVIDNSVLTAAGEIFTFAASIDGIDYLRNKNKKEE